MKLGKKLLAFVLAMAMVLSMGVSALAAQTGDLTINGTTSGETYDIYKVLDLTQSGTNYSYTVNDDFENFSFTAMGNDDLLIYIGSLETDSEAISELAQELVAYAVKIILNLQNL